MLEPAVATALTTVADRPPFLIAELPKPAPLPAVPPAVDERPIDKVLSSVADKTSTAAWGNIGLGSGFVIGASAIASWFSLPIGLVSLGVGLGLNPDALLVSAPLVVIGAATALVSTGVYRAKTAHTNRKLVESTKTQLEATKQQLAGAKGLERAWIIRRIDEAIHVVTSLPSLAPWGIKALYPGLEKRSYIASLRALTDKQVVSPADAEVAAKISELYVLGRHGKTAVAELDGYCARIAKLPPEARTILKANVMAPVLAELDKDNGNSYRRARFIEAFDDKRTPYSTEGLEVAASKLSLDTLRSDWNEKAAVATVGDTDAAVFALTRALRAGSKLASVLVSDVKAAERAAAYFEARDLFATIYKQTDGALRVSVFDPEHPPSDKQVRGNT